MNSAGTGAKGVERGEAHRRVLQMETIATPRHAAGLRRYGDATIPQLRADLAAAPRQHRTGVSGPLQAQGETRVNVTEPVRLAISMLVIKTLSGCITRLFQAAAATPHGGVLQSRSRRRGCADPPCPRPGRT
jgi:hypothetical protein